MQKIGALSRIPGTARRIVPALGGGFS